MARKVKRGDRVYILSGKFRGLTGVVQAVLVGVSRALVSGVPGVKRHLRASAGGPGGVVEKPVSIHLSNLSPVGPSGSHGRVGFRYLESGRKVRVIKSSGEVVDVG